MQTLAESHLVLGPEHVTIPPELVTIPTDNPNVILRQLIPDDAEVVFRTINSQKYDSAMMRFGDHVTREQSNVEATRDRIANAEGNEGNRRLILGIWDEGEFAGEVLLKPHKYNKGVDVIEYWVDKNHRGKGLAGLAAASASSYSLYERGSERVFAAINPKNKASERVVQRLGYFVLPPPQKDWYGVNKDTLVNSQRLQ
jgi:RimJ/RimL family protein N-acetyltransferase